MRNEQTAINNSQPTVKGSIMRKFLATLIASVAACGLSLVAGSPAHAATGTCSMVTWKKVNVTSPTKAVPAWFGSDCTAANVLNAEWWGTYQSGLLNTISTRVYLSTSDVALRRTTWTIDLAHHPMTKGTLVTFNASYCYSWSGVAVPQWGAVADVRLGTRIDVIAERVSASPTIPANTVRLMISGYGYNPKLNSSSTYMDSATVTIQTRASSTVAWTNLRTVTLDQSGWTGQNIYQPLKMQYRIVMADQPRYWGSTSATYTL